MNHYMTKDVYMKTSFYVFNNKQNAQTVFEKLLFSIVLVVMRVWLQIMRNNLITSLAEYIFHLLMFSQNPNFQFV